MALSAQQHEAVVRTGQDVCCVAGPGSGKTRVLVERFAWLVDRGSDPRRILAITFTEKAATELKERLARRFEGRDELRRQIERAPVSTIHAFCQSLLREHAVEAGLDPQFHVLDADREAAVERQSALEAVLDRWAVERRSEFQALFEAWDYGSEPYGALLDIHEALRVSGGVAEGLLKLGSFDADAALRLMEEEVRELLEASPTGSEARERRRAGLREWLDSKGALTSWEWVRSFQVSLRGLKREEAAYGVAERARERQAETLSVLAGAMHAPERATLRQILLDFDEEYAQRKRALAGVDFADLEEKALELLRSDAAVRRETSERYDAVLMDELQDTNPIQWAIVNEVRREGRFFAVGDVNQSIYGFRHAEPGLFEAYQESFASKGWTVDRLETNYRSRGEILSAVSAMAARCAGLRPHALVAREQPFGGKDGRSVEARIFEPGEDKQDYEAEWIAARLAELHGTLMVGDPPRPAGWGDMAVLARKAATLGVVEAALERRGIPSVVTSGGGFFQQQEVIDLVNWLRVLASPADEVALYAVLRSPFLAYSDESLFRARVDGTWPPAEAMERINAMRAWREEPGVDRLLALAVDESGYLSGAPERVRGNVEKFLDLVRAFERSEPGAIESWLGQIAEMGRGREANAPPVEGADAVQLLTVHKAKGLEFPVVLVASMQAGTGARGVPLSWSAEAGLGVSWRIEGEEKPVPDAIHVANLRRRKERDDLEEHRLLYVAMTRAGEHLVLSWRKPERESSPWPGIVEAGLGPDWTMAAKSELAGLPERGAMPAGAAVAVEWVELDRLEEEGEEAPVVAVTALAHFDECPRRFFLDRVVRWPGAAQPGADGAGGGGLALGMEVHELLAGKGEETAAAEALALRRVFEESALGRRAARAARVEREFDFLCLFEGVLLEGVIDLWFEEGGEAVVVDYKTGRSISGERMEAYRDQLRCYALALEPVLGRLPERAWLSLLNRREEIEVELGETARERCREVVARWKEAERRGVFEMRPGARCGWCPHYRGACPSPWRG